ncbi:hypothetical protein QQP08_008541 [Theobroma cacao]|nr:hypothetical protein QQP08_008541 [Theobroma cacao]
MKDERNFILFQRSFFQKRRTCLTQTSSEPYIESSALYINYYKFDVQAMNIILNPGLAFGTGEHPTTRLCLLLLQRLIKGGESFLGYGTGSRILSIAALKIRDPYAHSPLLQSQKVHKEKAQLVLNQHGLSSFEALDFDLVKEIADMNRDHRCLGLMAWLSMS